MTTTDEYVTHIVADASDDPEHVDDCPGCAAKPADDAREIRARLDEYAAQKTGRWIAPSNVVGTEVEDELDEQCERFARQDEAPAAFSALRLVLDQCYAKERQGYTTVTTEWLRTTIARELGIAGASE